MEENWKTFDSEQSKNSNSQTPPLLFDLVLKALALAIGWQPNDPESYSP